MSDFKTIAAAMERIDEWEITKRHLIHKSGISFYTGAGFECQSCRLGLFTLARLWFRAKRMQKRWLAMKLADTSSDCQAGDWA